MTTYSVEDLEEALVYAYSNTGIDRRDYVLPKQLDEAAIELFRCSDVESINACIIKAAINDLRIDGMLKFTDGTVVIEG